MRSALKILPGVMACMTLLMAVPKAQAQTQLPPHWEESGEASWYGGWHQGRRTSSGARFDQNAMTAAHADLPLGSRVRVTVQETGASVVVTVNDRQPPKYLRIIDLSRGAAAQLGLVGRGHAMVTLSPAEPGAEFEVAQAPDADEPAVARPHRRPGGRGR
jgi:rare lipoprotein A